MNICPRRNPGPFVVTDLSNKTSSAVYRGVSGKRSQRKFAASIDAREAQKVKRGSATNESSSRVTFDFQRAFEGGRSPSTTKKFTKAKKLEPAKSPSFSRGEFGAKPSEADQTSDGRRKRFPSISSLTDSGIPAALTAGISEGAYRKVTRFCSFTSLREHFDRFEPRIFG
jgi:hypothetical protein